MPKERNIAPENCHLRIGFDNCGQFYKGTLSLLDKSADPKAKPKFGELFKDTRGEEVECHRAGSEYQGKL